LLQPLAVGGEIGDPFATEAALFLLCQTKPAEGLAVVGSLPGNDAKVRVAEDGDLFAGPGEGFARSFDESVLEFLARRLEVISVQKDQTAVIVEAPHHTRAFVG